MSVMPFGNALTRPFARRQASVSTAISAPSPTELLHATTPSEWVGALGEHVRVPVEIIAMHDEGHNIKTYLVRQIDTANLLEWSSALRYGFHLGERLQLSGLVQAYNRRDGVRVTTLHECFNPLRMN